MLHYGSKRRKVHSFSEYSLPIAFQEIYMKNIYYWKMLMMSKVILLLNQRIEINVKRQLKKNFLNNLRLFFGAREKVLTNFKSRLFSVKKLNKFSTREPTSEQVIEPAKQKKSKLKLQQGFMNEIIADEKDINDEKLWNYVKYQNPFLLAKDLIRAKQANSKQ